MLAVYRCGPEPSFDATIEAAYKTRRLGTGAQWTSRRHAWRSWRRLRDLSVLRTACVQVSPKRRNLQHLSCTGRPTCLRHLPGRPAGAQQASMQRPPRPSGHATPGAEAPAGQGHLGTAMPSVRVSSVDE